MNYKFDMEKGEMLVKLITQTAQRSIKVEKLLEFIMAHNENLRMPTQEEMGQIDDAVLQEIGKFLPKQ